MDIVILFCWCHFHRLVLPFMPKKQNWMGCKKTDEVKWFLNEIQNKNEKVRTYYVNQKRKKNISDFHATKRVLNICLFISLLCPLDLIGPFTKKLLSFEWAFEGIHFSNRNWIQRFRQINCPYTLGNVIKRPI